MTEQSRFDFTLNGRPARVEGGSPHLTLLEHLRGCGLTGTKEGCAEGECGSCTVLFVEGGPSGTRYVPTNSCLVPLPAVAGQEVITVEGLSPTGELCAVQKAIAQGGGSQCGYCTPGMAVSMFAEHHRRQDRPVDVAALRGVLCRCTGYRPLRDALLSLGPPPSSAALLRLHEAAPPTKPLRYIAEGLAYTRPAGLSECMELLVSDQNACLVAGNTDSGVRANLAGEQMAHRVDVRHLPELRRFIVSDEAIEIGAGLTVAEIVEQWIDPPKAFVECARLFGSPQIRNRATLGGNLATASPVGDLSPLLMCLDADVVIASASGLRHVPVSEFATGVRRSALRRGEVIFGARIPTPLPEFTSFHKVSKRSCNDIAAVSAALSLRRNAGGLIVKARIAYGGVAPTPLRVHRAEDALVGTIGSEQDFGRAGQIVASSLKPINDVRGSAAYRRSVARNLLTRFLMELPKP